MEKSLRKVRGLLQQFKDVTIAQIPQEQNQELNMPQPLGASFGMTKGDNMPLEFIEHPNIEEVEDTHTPSKEPRLDGTLCLLPLGQARASW